MRKYLKNTLLVVDWVDIKSDPAWQSDEEATVRPDDIDVKTCGFYTCRDATLLYLADTYGKGVRDKTTIPIGCITRIEIVQLPAEKRIWTPRKKR